MGKVMEICVETAEGATAAIRAGGKRVEICANRAVGGVTSDPVQIAMACREIGSSVHVLIRPRPGDFVYSREEIARMSSDIDRARTLGASGVVIGVLCPDGRIDLEQVERLVAHARPLSVTFHKAFDLTPDPFRALDELIGLKIDRILTSGQAPTAREGSKLLAELGRQAVGRITIMAGGSLRLDDLAVMHAAGLEEIHLGSAAEKDGVIDEDTVRRLVRAWEGYVDPPSRAE